RRCGAPLTRSRMSSHRIDRHRFGRVEVALFVREEAAPELGAGAQPAVGARDAVDRDEEWDWDERAEAADPPGVAGPSGVDADLPVGGGVAVGDGPDLAVHLAGESLVDARRGPVDGHVELAECPREVGVELVGQSVEVAARGAVSAWADTGARVHTRTRTASAAAPGRAAGRLAVRPVPGPHHSGD